MFAFINDTLESKKRVDIDEGYIYVPIKVKEVFDDLYKVYQMGFEDGVKHQKSVLEDAVVDIADEIIDNYEDLDAEIIEKIIKEHGL